LARCWRYSREIGTQAGSDRRHGHRSPRSGRADSTGDGAGDGCKRAGPRQRNIFWTAATKSCPISCAMPKSRDVASRASPSIAGEGSEISIVCSLPRCRIVMANVGVGAARAADCDTSCSRACALATEHGVGIVNTLTSAVWRGPLERRKLMPDLKHVTCSDPTVTPSRPAISSRLIPSATNSFIFWMTRGVNLMRLPLAAEPARSIIMTTPL
jgi:hypothetical protein